MTRTAPDAIWRLVGLATRARRLVTGSDTVEQTISKGQACLIILAGDATTNTHERFAHLARRHELPLVVLGTRDELSHWTGKPDRVVAAVTDTGFAERIWFLYQSSRDESRPETADP